MDECGNQLIFGNMGKPALGSIAIPIGK